MDALLSRPWRWWPRKGQRAKDTAAMPHVPAFAPAPPLSAVPPVPAPIRAEQPAPRVVWEDPAGRTVRLIATDWADGVTPTYSVEAAHGTSWWASGDGTLWVPATGEECWAMLMALASAIDERGERREAGGERP